jgi:integrase
MAVIPRGGSFQVYFYWEGKRVRRSFTNKPEALAWEAEAKAKLATGKPLEEAAPAPASDNRTLEWLKEETLTRYWKGTANETEALRCAEEVVEILGAQRHPKAVTTTDVDELITKLKSNGNSAATVNRKLAALSKMMTHALRVNIIDRKPMIERQKETEGRIRWYRPEEEAAVLAYLEEEGELDFRDLIMFLCDTGCRLGEAFKLQWRDVNDVFVELVERKAGNSTGVPQTPRVRELLKRRGGNAKPMDLVFPGWDKKKACTAWGVVRKAVGLIGEEDVLHAWRHTCASRLVQAGTPIQVVQQWLGHKSLRMTMRYAHLSPTNLLSAMQALVANPAPEAKKASADSKLKAKKPALELVGVD